jgi:DNA-binding transcriptional MerR regulator
MNAESKTLPAIPAKRYFTIGEVSELCGVKPYVLRYWEQEFTQLKPMKRRGNRRYYQHHEVLLIRRIRDLLYEQGFTISGARNQLTEPAAASASPPPRDATAPAVDDPTFEDELEARAREDVATIERARRAVDFPRAAARAPAAGNAPVRIDERDATQLRAELLAIRALLVG